MNRFKIRYVKNCNILWPDQEIVTTYVFARTEAEAVQYVSFLPSFVEIRSVEFDFSSRN